MADTFAIVGAGLAGARAAETRRRRGVRRSRRALRRRGAPPLRAASRSPRATCRALRVRWPFVHPAEWYAQQGRRPAPRHEGHRARPGHARGRDGRRRPAWRYTKLLLTTGRVERLRGLGRRPLTLRTIEDSAGDPGRRWPRGGGSSFVGGGVDRAGGGLRCPGGRCRRHGARVAGRAAADWGCSGRRSPRCSPTCIASTESTCAPESWETLDGDTAVETGVRLADGTVLPADAVVVGIGAGTQRRARAGSRAGRRQRHHGRRHRPDGGKTRTSSRWAMWPTSSTPSSDSGSGWSTGPTPCNQPQLVGAAAMLDQDGPRGGAAVLLHRPVRPRHGVHRRARPEGEVVVRGDGRASSSRSGCGTGGSRRR